MSYTRPIHATIIACGIANGLIIADGCPLLADPLQSALSVFC